MRRGAFPAGVEVGRLAVLLRGRTGVSGEVAPRTSSSVAAVKMRSAQVESAFASAERMRLCTAAGTTMSPGASGPAASIFDQHVAELSAPAISHGSRQGSL